MAIKFTNNAKTTLAAGITSGDLSFTVAGGGGALFPTLAAGDHCWITFIDTSNNKEIVKCSARAGDVFTIPAGGRGADGTTPRAFITGDKVELRNPRALLTDVALYEGLEVSQASGSSIDLGAIPSHSILITGTTTITDFATADSGVRRNLRFQDALTLTHSANLLCPGAVDIVVAANDTLEVVSLGSGVWRVVSYRRASTGVDNILGTALNATEWNGAVKTVSTSAPAGGNDDDIHIQY